MSSAFEILDIIISAPLYTQAILAAAAVLGAGVAKVTAKLLDGLASEAGKDLYRWLKESVTAALRKTRNAHASTRERLSVPSTPPWTLTWISSSAKCCRS